METLKVGLLYGGWSYESYLCAHPSVEKALKRLGHDVTSIQTADENLASTLIAADFDVAFLASHGCFHEDGRLQSICEWIGLPYTGPNHFASSLCMNKVHFKRFADLYSDEPMPYAVATLKNCKPTYEQLQLQLGASEMILKPALSGASVGIRTISSADELERHLPITIQMHGDTIIEPLLRNFRELSVTAHDFNGDVRVLDTCELLTCGKPFDFDMKNGYQAIEKRLPSDLSSTLLDRIKRITLDVYADIGLESIVRVDMLLDDRGNIHVLEVNTLPGLMPQSVAPAAVAQTGMSYDDLIHSILMAGLRRKRFEVTKQRSNQPRLSDNVVL